MPLLAHTQSDPSGSDYGGFVGRLVTHPGLPLPHLLALAEHDAVPVIAALVVAVSGVLVVAARVRRRRERRWAVGARQVEILVPPEVRADSAQVLWEHLHGALTRTWWERLWSGQHLLGFEYRITADQGASLRLWVPATVPPHLVENAVSVAWPGARTHTSPAEPPLPAAPAGHHRLLTGGELRLGRHDRWPIRTDAPGDTATALIAAASGMQPDHTACVQVLARPVTTRRRLSGPGTGPGSGRAAGVAGFGLELTREFLGLFTPGPGRLTSAPARTEYRGRDRDRQVRLEQSARDRAAAIKAHSPQWATIVRYAVTAPVAVDADPMTRARTVRVIRGRAHAISSYLSGASQHNHYRRRRTVRLADALFWRRLGRGDVLSSPELAVLAHLPREAGIAEIHRAGARALAPDKTIASGGPGTKPLGRADARTGRDVALRVEDARHHIHVLGPTGTGKSTLLARMVLADADARRGLVLIDPKGDLVTDVLDRLPADCAQRVVLFDTASTGPPPCINPLDLYTFGENRNREQELDRVVDNVGTIFARIYHQFWGPRTDDVFRNSLRTVCAQPRPATLADVERLLTDDTFRARLTMGVKDPIVQRYWRAFDALGEAGRGQLTAPLLNKLRQLLLRRFVAASVAGGPATVDLGAVLDEGGLVLARLPKGRLGEETTRLLGALLVARTWQAAIARTDTPESTRRDAALYLDEFHNFLHTHTPVEDMLAEARGMRLSMVLAHQNLGQLTPTLREAVSTNARNKIYFAPSPEDSRELARHTQPQLSEYDLAHLDAYHAAARLVVGGANTAPCTLTTHPLPPPIPGRARQIRTATRTRAAASSVPQSLPAAVSTPRLRIPAPRIPRPDPRRH